MTGPAFPPPSLAVLRTVLLDQELELSQPLRGAADALLNHPEDEVAGQTCAQLCEGLSLDKSLVEELAHQMGFADSDKMLALWPVPEASQAEISARTLLQEVTAQGLASLGTLGHMTHQPAFPKAVALLRETTERTLRASPEAQGPAAHATALLSARRLDAGTALLSIYGPPSEAILHIGPTDGGRIWLSVPSLHRDPACVASMTLITALARAL